MAFKTKEGLSDMVETMMVCEEQRGAIYRIWEMSRPWIWKVGPEQPVPHDINQDLLNLPMRKASASQCNRQPKGALNLFCLQLSRP